MKSINAVAIDLSPHPYVQYAVVHEGLLLPIRFSSEAEAERHLKSMELGEPIPAVSADEVAA